MSFEVTLPTNNSVYRSLGLQRQALITGGITVATYVILPDGSIALTAGAAARGIFHFDPALYAVSGLTTKLRFSVLCAVNDAAPAATFTVGLYPVLSVSGSSSGSMPISLDTVVTGTTVQFATPSADSLAQTAATDVTAPAAGFYALAVAVSGGTTAATSGTYLRVNVQARNV